jgi:integral membrane protein
MEESQKKLHSSFLTVGHLEGISFLVLLFIAMPLKHFFKLPIAVSIAGMLHGVLFILFCFMLYRMLTEAKWSFLKCIKAFLLGFLPFGTFFLNRLK